MSDLLHNEINDEDSSEDEGIISKFVIENFDTNVNTIIQPENNADNNIKTKRKCTDIPVLTKWAIVARYMEGTNPKTNRLYQGVLDNLCNVFSVSKRTIQRIVLEYKEQRSEGKKIPNMLNKKLGVKKTKRIRLPDPLS